MQVIKYGVLGVLALPFIAILLIGALIVAVGLTGVFGLMEISNRLSGTKEWSI